MKLEENHTDPWDCYAPFDHVNGPHEQFIESIDASLLYYDKDSLTVWSGEYIKQLMKESKDEME